MIVDVVSGFHARLPLTEPELAAVFPLVLGRAAGGAVSTWQQAMAEPGNRYANDLIEIDWGSLAAVAAVDRRPGRGRLPGRLRHGSAPGLGALSATTLPRSRWCRRSSRGAVS